MDTPPHLDALQTRVFSKLEELRETLRDYKRAAKRPPLFLHERRAPRMRDDAFANARVFADRHQMMRALATGETGAEVGVQGGNFSRFFLDELPVKRLHLLDLSLAQIRQDVREDPRVTLHGGDSSTNLSRLPRGSLDWAYIDGDHSYSGAMKDARAALEAVKPGGFLFFNDYTLWSPGEALSYGVMAVVHELVNEGHDMLAVALTPTGYFDIALQR